MITVSVSGADLAKRALLLLDSECQKECVAAVDASSAQWVQEATARVPRRSGKLASTIRRVFSKDRLVAWGQVGYGSVKRKRDRKKPGVQALVIEVGSADGRHPAEPFAHPASEIVKPQHAARIAAALDRAANRVSSGAAS